MTEPSIKVQHPPLLPEVYVSVDVESAGPTPGGYALLSIGACLVNDLDCNFYIELKPDRAASQPEAMSVNGLSMESLAEHGVEPAEAMRRFEQWLGECVPPGARAIFTGFNAPFDWMFVDDYFHRYLGHNPFGHNALDMKAYYMGMRGVHWAETRMERIMAGYGIDRHLSHNALEDAQDQARLFQHMLAEAEEKRSSDQ